MMPEVSVVMPAFDAASTIERAARSILDQTLRNIELIVVDDGSTDETVAIVNQIHDPRVRVDVCPHRGVAETANRGMELSSAPIIARMDADDFSHPLRLEKQIKLLNEADLDVVGCQVRILDHLGRQVETMQRYERWVNEETITSRQITSLRFVELPLVNPTILARRSYFELEFHDHDLPEDYDLMLRAAAAGMTFGKVTDVLYDWTDGPSRLTRRDARYSAEAFYRCRRTHLLAGPLCGVREVDLWGAGQTGKRWLQWLQSEGITVRHGYDVDTRKVGKTIHGVEIIHRDNIPTADGTPLIIAVGAEGARGLILPHIQQRGYISGRDAWFVA